MFPCTDVGVDTRGLGSVELVTGDLSEWSAGVFLVGPDGDAIQMHIDALVETGGRGLEEVYRERGFVVDGSVWWDVIVLQRSC